MSISKVAKLAGVSSTTVSFVVNSKPGISPSTASKVRAAMKQVGYTPKSNNSKPDFHKADFNIKIGSIGIVMAERAMSTVPFWARLFEAIQHELNDKKLNMVPLRFSQDLSTLGSFSDVDGLLLCAYHKEIADKLSMPFVSVLNHPDIDEELHADHIEPANERIGAMAANYFINRGHKNLIALNPSSPHPALETRVQNFVGYCRKKRISAEAVEVLFNERDEQGRLYDGSRIESIQRFISEFRTRKCPPTGIFIPCDSHLVVMQKSFKDAGIIPGQDVEFLGCNNEPFLFDGLTVRPATIDINPEMMAKSAVLALLHRIGEAKSDNNNHVFKIISIDATIVPAGCGVKERW